MAAGLRNGGSAMVVGMVSESIKHDREILPIEFREPLLPRSPNIFDTLRRGPGRLYVGGSLRSAILVLYGYPIVAVQTRVVVGIWNDFLQHTRICQQDVR